MRGGESKMATTRRYVRSQPEALACLPLPGWPDEGSPSIFDGCWVIPDVRRVG
jgi:hypothetical protein